MARTLGGSTIVALLFAAVAAQASEATMLAGRAGFLLGHAHRCGVAEDRLQRSAAFLTEVIAASASDDEDSAEARARFAERALAGAMAGLLPDPVPRCAIVRAALAQLEQRPGDKSVNRHQRAGQMARSASALSRPSPKAEIRQRAKPAKSVKPASQRRAAPQLRQAARQGRSKPPSI